MFDVNYVPQVETEQELHNVVTSSVSADQVKDAGSVGISLGYIVMLIIKYGAAASAILADLVASLRKHTQPPATA